MGIALGFLTLGITLGLLWRAYQWKRARPMTWVDKDAEYRRRYYEWLSKKDRSGSVISTPGLRTDD